MKAIREYRIYYEVLEQAAHFVEPLLYRFLQKQTVSAPVKLVRIPRVAPVGEGSLAALLSITSPDLIVTAVSDEHQEIVLLTIEFSEAVKTEDHEYQRATALVAAAQARTVSLKIAGQRESQREHGGNVDFDPWVFGRLCEQLGGYRGYFLEEWPKEAGLLLRDPKYLSCPSTDKMPLTAELLETAIETVVAHAAQLTQATYLDSFLTRADKKPHVTLYRERCAAATPNAGSLTARVLWPSPARTETEWLPERVTVLKDSNTLVVKINRWAHSADPDRGVLLFLSGIWTNGQVRALYRMEKGGKTQTRPALTVAYGRPLLKEAFAGYAREEGLQSWFVREVESLEQNSADFTDAIVRNVELWKRNKVMKALFQAADGLLIMRDRGDTPISLTWDRRRLPLPPLRLVGEYFKVEGTAPAPRLKAVDNLNEDEITYVTVHDVLRPNDFVVASVSYPGSQGALAILPPTESGRTRARIYVDVVSVRNDPEEMIALTEAKESLTATLEHDLDRLRQMRDDSGMKSALVAKLQAIGHQVGNRASVLVSISFGPGIVSSVSVEDVDFLIRLKNRKSWEVAPFGTRGELFASTHGNCSLPSAFECEIAVPAVEPLV